MLQTEWREESLIIARRIAEHVADRAITPGQFAIAWLLNNRLVSAPAAGPRTEEQWEDYLLSLTVTFTSDDEALVDRLVVAGHPSTPVCNDPSYRIESRLPLATVEGEQG